MTASERPVIERARDILNAFGTFADDAPVSARNARECAAELDALLTPREPDAGAATTDTERLDWIETIFAQSVREAIDKARAALSRAQRGTE